MRMDKDVADGLQQFRVLCVFHQMIRHCFKNLGMDLKSFNK